MRCIILPVHAEAVHLQATGQCHRDEREKHANDDAESEGEVVARSVQSRVDHTIHDRDQDNEEHHIKQGEPRRRDLFIIKTIIFMVFASHSEI